jgi:hypothetical protein
MNIEFFPNLHSAVSSKLARREVVQPAKRLGHYAFWTVGGAYFPPQFSILKEFFGPEFFRLVTTTACHQQPHVINNEES